MNTKKMPSKVIVLSHVLAFGSEFIEVKIIKDAFLVLVSVTKNGRVVRGWDRKSGTLIWEATITSVTKE